MTYPCWKVKKPACGAQQAFEKAGIGPLLARVLAGRGYADISAAQSLFGEGDPLSDPYRMKDMDKAVIRIRRAIVDAEPLVIFGDYDVDGVCATAILYEYLTSLGAHVRCMLPSREGGGYGISCAILDQLAAKGYTLVVTVDNGISAIAEARHAKENGIDLVITDHHLPQRDLPDAVAVVDPNRSDDESPFKYLCGAGVALKLCAALEGCLPEELLEPYGELAAMGTIADVMPLLGENRTLVRAGLSLLQDTMRPGLRALIKSAGYADRGVNTDTVSYGLAPRLNAAGRMDSASVSLKLLLCENEEQAEGIADRLNEINSSRQAAEQTIYAAAQEKLAADPALARNRVIVLAGEGWHNGVIGIVASRLCEQYYRPVIVISLQNGEGRGSGRAPIGFNLHNAIASCADMLIRYGGHAAAAGLLIQEEKLPAFRAAINAWAMREQPTMQPPDLELDACAPLEELNLSNVQELARLAPYGRGNPEPLFLVRNARIDGVWPLGAEGRHCRIRLRQGADTLFVSRFGTAPEDLPYAIGTPVDVALQVNIFNGRNGPMVSAQCKAIKPAGLENTASKLVSLFEDFRAGSKISAFQARQLLPGRVDCVKLYRRIQHGGVYVKDLQPEFAEAGAENTGKVLVGLEAMLELGLVEERDGRYLPSRTAEKKNLESAPVLVKLHALAAKEEEEPWQSRF